MTNQFIPTPKSCDICGTDLSPAAGTEMFDARTCNGQWGCMCKTCFEFEGGTLGLGRGQRYTRRTEFGPFMYVEGCGE